MTFRQSRKQMRTAWVWVNVLLLAASLCAQNSNSSNYEQRTKAIQERDSRAQKEADRLVALSPDKIISILIDEPGLLLQVKKLLPGADNQPSFFNRHGERRP